MAPRSLRLAASATSTLALVAAGIAATTTTAQAIPDPDVNTTLCTDAPGLPGGVQPVWTGGFTDGQPVHGLTTTRGTTPEAFTGEYVGTLPDGAGVRGKDILLFRMEGSRITRTTSGGDVVTDAGIWAGMSGSPVYDADDNLIGSVSYGFSGAPSNLAGVTPAKDILDLQSSPAAASAARVAVPKSISRAAAASTVTTADDASDFGDIRPLALPKVSVGTPGKDATKIAAQSRYLKKALPGSTLKFRTASSAATDIDPVTAIVPGGNVATAYTHGDVALASVGTVTAVCGTKVFAYGHPDNYNGNKATETFHAAAAAEIQEDAVLGSYKLANIDMDPVGQITQDRVSGILGITGQIPAETTVTTNTTLGAETTTAQTKVPVPAAVSTAVSAQLFNDVMDGLDEYVNGGSALMTWTIGYTPKGGTPATFTRTQRFAYDEYLAEQVGYDVSSDVEFLQFGSDQKVAITSVTVDTTLSSDYDALRLSKVEIRKNGAWVKVKNGQRLSVPRGKDYLMQVTLTPDGPDSVATPVVKRLDARVSGGATGPGVLAISGGNSAGGDFSEFTITIDEDDEELFYDEDPLTLAQVLAALKAQPRYDSVNSTQLYVNGLGQTRTTSKTISSPAVTNGSYLFNVSYKK